MLCIAFCSGLSQRTQRFPACLSSALLLLQTHHSPALLIPLCLCMWFPGTTLPRFTPRSSDLTQGLRKPSGISSVRRKCPFHVHHCAGGALLSQPLLNSLTLPPFVLPLDHELLEAGREAMYHKKLYTAWYRARFIVDNNKCLLDKCINLFPPLSSFSIIPTWTNHWNPKLYTLIGYWEGLTIEGSYSRKQKLSHSQK